MASVAPETHICVITSELPVLHIQSWHIPSTPSPLSLCEISAPVDLLTLLSNSIIANQISPHLPASSLLALGATSHAVRNCLSYTWTGARYLDLSPIKRLCLDSNGPVVNGGHNWRTESIDERLTEDAFYGGPLRGAFKTIEQRLWLQTVSTLILDGLTVTAEVVLEIISEDRFNVKILSVRDCQQLNYQKLSQILKYAVRPSRPIGTPKLRGLYVFGPKEPSTVKEEVPIGRRRSPTRYPESRPSQTVSAVGASLGPDWERRTQATLVAEQHEFDDDKWYHSAGKIVTRPVLSEWAETLQACEGIIHFDAVLCRGPRHQLPEPGADASSWLGAAVATIALGPSGCEKCGTCPEGPGIFGQSPSHHLPLLAPPPLTSSTIRAAQMPSSSSIVRYKVPKLIARCKDCLRSRWCERCHKWWCESCYNPGTWTLLQERELADNMMANPDEQGRPEPEHIQVHMGLCVDTCLVNDMMVEESWPFLESYPIGTL